jgi:undecaprenyl diphosphate synthase
MVDRRICGFNHRRMKHLLESRKADVHARGTRMPRYIGLIPDGNRRRPDESDLPRYVNHAPGIVPVSSEGVALLVIGDRHTRLSTDAPEPPPTKHSPDDMRVHLLVHYGWQWDLSPSPARSRRTVRSDPLHAMAARGASRIDPIVRWGGRRRVSGSLPLQSANADVYVVDTLWLDMQSEGFIEALCWYARQDRTPGG